MNSVPQASETAQEKFEMLKFKLDMGWERPAPERITVADEPTRKKVAQRKRLEPAQTLLARCEDRMVSLKARHRRKGFDTDCMISGVDLERMFNEQEGRCYYSGVEMDWKTHNEPDSMSIDRIDSEGGYTKDNIVLCCWFVNCAKNRWPIELIKKYWRRLPM